MASGGFLNGQLLMWMIILVVAVMVLVAAGPYLMALIDFLLRRKKNFIEEADDAHVALYRKRKKIAAINLKHTLLKFVVNLGDEDYHESGRYSRIRGLTWKGEIIEFFQQPRRFRPWLWSMAPRELVRDALGRNLRIKCNGWEPVGNIYKPIYTKDIRDKKVKIVSSNPGTFEISLAQWYDMLLLDNEEWILKLEKSIEAEEQAVHAMIDAVDTKRRAEGLIKRPDYAPMTPGEPERGDQYERE